MRELVLGIDGSQRHNGWCAVLPDGSRIVGSFFGIENLGEQVELLKLAMEPYRVFALIECPTWGGHGTREVRTSVSSWERWLRKSFADIKIARIDPNDWQFKLLGSMPKHSKETRKTQSLRRATSGLGIGVQSDHEADAVCISEAAILIKRGLMEMPRKKKKKGGKR